VHHCSEPPLSKTIFLARMGKEDVEGEGVGGEVYATLGRETLAHRGSSG
jgi:hypothetical protein